MRYLPMLCQPGGKEWLGRKGFVCELKLDGYRLILRKDKGRVELFNRKGALTSEYELGELSRFIRPESCVLDGEAVVYDRKGIPRFELMQKKSSPLTYVAFDILEINGTPLIGKPLSERKKILDMSVIESRGIEIMLVTRNSRALWRKVKSLGLEGVVAKKEDSTYQPGSRSWDWVKIKNLNTLDVVIVGFSSKKRPVSSLAMGLYGKGGLVYVGKVGTGFSEPLLENLRILFRGMAGKVPVVNPPEEKISWLKPSLVAEVEYLEVTNNRQLRAPSFRRFRNDKPALQCTFSQIA